MRSNTLIMPVRRAKRRRRNITKKTMRRTIRIRPPATPPTIATTGVERWVASVSLSADGPSEGGVVANGWVASDGDPVKRNGSAELGSVEGVGVPGAVGKAGTESVCAEEDGS